MMATCPGMHLKAAVAAVEVAKKRRIQPATPVRIGALRISLV